MIIPDVNLLVYAHNTGAPEHVAAQAWWEQAVNAGQPSIGLPWIVILGFVRVCTLPTVLTNPMRANEATAIVRSWLAQPVVRLIEPGERHAEIFLGLIDETGVAGNLTTDAHLAALAIEYHAEVATNDTDFSRFRGLRWFNPLKPGRRR